MSDGLDRLDADVRAILERERDASLSPPDAVRARIRSAVLGTVPGGGGPSGGGPSGGGPSGGGPSGGGPSGGGSTPSTEAATSLAPSSAATWSTSTLAVAVTGALVLGALGGAASYAAWVEPRASTSTAPSRATDGVGVDLDEPAPRASALAPNHGGREAEPDDEVVVVDLARTGVAGAGRGARPAGDRAASAPPSAASAQRGSSEPSIGDQESTLIDEARVALGRGRAHDALVALMRHEREHPGGALVEERERLIIEALITRGMRAAAGRRAQAFLEAHPGTAYRAVIERSLGTHGAAATR